MFKICCRRLVPRTNYAVEISSHYNIATWSALANAFNTKPVWKSNLGLKRSEAAGLFNIPQLTDHSGFYLLKDKVISRTEHLLKETRSDDRKRKMVDIFDDLSDTLCRVADMSEFIRIAHPKHKFKIAADHACTEISNLVEELNTNTRLYESLRQVVEEGDKFETDEIDEHVAKLFLFDFEQSGVHLDEEKRNKVLKLNDQILQQGSFFLQNCNLPRSVPKDQLSDAILKVFPTSREHVQVEGLHAEARNENIREAAYKVYLYPDAHQEELLAGLLNARQELALLCGFPSYAHRSLTNSLAGSPAVVSTFLDKLAGAVSFPAKRDFHEMRSEKLLSDNFNSLELKPWDIPYYTAKIKDKRYDIYIPEYAAYLTLGSCMQALNSLLINLFQVELQVVAPENGEVWHPDIYKLAVNHLEEGLLGYIYCDFFEREDKPNQDCHFTIQGGRLLPDGSYQLPIVVLLLNFPPVTEKAPSCLTPGMVENLFHEMGHAMHSMLGRTKHQHVTGTRCSTDFAEVPSILMETFANDPRIIKTFTHLHTGANMPNDLIERLCDSRNLFNASETQLQIFYSMVDHLLHTQPLAGKSTTQVLASVQEKYYGLPYEPGTAWQLRFSHLVGYGAKYYSYLMARAVASLIWQHGFINDPFSRTWGQRYRRDILSHGGGRPPKELIERFLGREITPELLTEALIAEINEWES